MSASILDVMASHGLVPHKALDLLPDGRLRRFRVAGDKAGSANGWVVWHGEAGAFGSWRTGESHGWREATTKPMTPAERSALAQKLAQMRAARAEAQAQVHSEAATKAARLWGRARPATNAHPYLTAKRVHAIGVRQLRDMLLIPARDVHGGLHTLQFIGADGTKRFLTGGRIVGCYCAIGRPVDSLLLCEGYATGATLHQATGQAVAVAFNCGNLQPVAVALRSKFPALKLIVCADNDAATPGNPGVTHAKAAARAVGGFLAVPAFGEVRA